MKKLFQIWRLCIKNVEMNLDNMEADIGCDLTSGSEQYLVIWE